MRRPRWPGRSAPLYPGKRHVDWALGDPSGQGVESVFGIPDEIDRRVRALAAELAPPVGLEDRYSACNTSPPTWFRPLELRRYLDEAVHERRTVWIHDVESPQDNGSNIQAFDVQVQPLVDEAGTMLGTTITFNDVTRYRQLQAELEYSNRRLETAYEELQSTNEELETTNEELQSTVEELETTNEELQSTNEELETMNAELQSMNDELHFSNDQLRDRQAEVDDLNMFMESVLAGLRAGVAVVDRELKVLAWNTRAEDLWGVRTDEAIGQHLLNLDIGLPLEELLPSLRRQVNAEDSDYVTLQLAAVNRRGRAVDVNVTVSPLHGSASDNSGAILVMDLPEE